MKVEFHRNFDKLYAKLPAKVRTRFEERVAIFLSDPFDSVLRNHALHGEWEGYRSINVTGDYRAIYEPVGEEEARFVAIGTHSQLYE